MNKLLLLIINVGLIIAFNVIMWGIVLPAMISAVSTPAIVLAWITLIGTVCFDVWWINKAFNQIKNLFTL